jgi:hypothetical protein
MAVTYNRYKFVTVSLPKRFRNGRFNSETPVRRFQNVDMPHSKVDTTLGDKKGSLLNVELW